MTLKQRVPMPLQDAQERIRNFDEVALGYTIEQAQQEADRCLNCRNPRCVTGCPVNINIPAFIHKITQGDYDGAYEIITQSNSLPAVCGRVCPQENQCEGSCWLGMKGGSVSIGNLERFVADYYNSHSHCATDPAITKQSRVAIVGAGPSGLACAGELNRLGYPVTIFEALSIGGGVLNYGIPEFRLPKRIVNQEIDCLLTKGVQLITNRVIGRNENIQELFDEGYKAVFIGTGAGLPGFLGIKGEELKGVYSANEYLTRVNLMHADKPDYATPLFIGKKVVVIGGGNVAMDGARVARRLGAEVHIVYRRAFEQLPARHEEVIHAQEEGIIFDLLTNPVSIVGDEKGFVSRIECQRMTLGQPDASGRARPVAVKGSNFFIDCDCIIVAVGTTPNPLIRMTTPNLQFNKHGCVVIQENGLTSMQGVYAGGDAVTGAATVISAMGAGKIAATSIDEYLSSL
ncbi:MAG: NADPH-dependent glutamate synthase [Clostridia bacterium]|nr:NADPH-dependent glutamate synthase [Clostridia bacterium]